MASPFTPASDHPDNRIRTLSITPLRKRAGLSRDQFQRYWKDVHGPVCARLPHLALYVQHHTSLNDPDLFPHLPGVERSASAVNDWNGFAEIAFFSEDDLDQWLPSTSVLFSDEQNVFEATVAYQCPDSSKTLLDDGSVRASSGTSPFFYLFIRLHPDADAAEAVAFLREDLLAALAEAPTVHRIRYHVLTEHDNSTPNPPAPNVDHHLDVADQHQVVVELSADSVLDLRRAYRTPDVEAALGRLPAFVQAVHPYASAGRYTFCYDGQITLAGLRGASTAHLIETVGAINQVGEAVEALIHRGALS